MLHDQGLPFHLWAEACKKVVFVQKYSPHRILGMSTPEEDFFGKKLELTTKIGIFVGYNDTPHNYRVYLPANRMTVARRYVIFDEEKSM